MVKLICVFEFAQVAKFTMFLAFHSCVTVVVFYLSCFFAHVYIDVAIEKVCQRDCDLEIPARDTFNCAKNSFKVQGPTNTTDRFMLLNIEIKALKLALAVIGVSSSTGSAELDHEITNFVNDELSRALSSENADEGITSEMANAALDVLGRVRESARIY